jgi:hypothetical protein
MDWNEIIATIVPVLLTSVIIPAIIVVGKKLNTLIDMKVKNDDVKKYLTIAADCVVDSVEDTAHTYVDKIAEGDWDDTKKRLALETAKDQILENIGVAGQEALTDALGDFDKWLETKINAQVQRRKLAQPAVFMTLAGPTAQPGEEAKQ